MQAHVALVEADGGVRMGCTVIEEVCGCACGGFGAFGLGCCEGAEGDEHGAIDGSGVIQEGANDFLDALALVSFQWGGIIGCGVLDFGAVVWRRPWIRRIGDGKFSGAAESFDGFLDVLGH